MFSKSADFPLCVGIDPDFQTLEFESIKEADEYYRKLIVGYAPYCSAYKFNISFFEALGLEALAWLKDLIAFAKHYHPIILDAKRADVGHTAVKQAKYIFEVLGADATTLHPYMGIDSLKPFFEYDTKYHFVLACTSNPSAAEIEFLKSDQGKYVAETVYDYCIEWHAAYQNVGVVMGATQNAMLDYFRKKDDSLLYLMPGVGAQGAKFHSAVQKGENKDNQVLVNVGRALLLNKTSVDQTNAFHEQCMNVQALRSVDK